MVPEAHFSDFVRDVVEPLIPADEPRLGCNDLARAIVEFCAGVDEFWAWCPTPELLSQAFGLGEDAGRVFARYWDWDLQLLKRTVYPWPEGWPQELCDLHRAALDRRIEVPPNEYAHHPRSDACGTCTSGDCSTLRETKDRHGLVEPSLENLSN